MKYKLFVVGDPVSVYVNTFSTAKAGLNDVVMEIAASDEFGNLEMLIKQLDLFGTQWEVTEYGVTVFSADVAAK